MPRFFIKDENIGNTDTVTITGEDARHISFSLRMRVGDNITLCDFFNYEYDCTIKSIDGEKVVLDICDKHPSQNEPNIKVSVYQALPKAQKLELIIQKCVELGVFEIVPVLTSRCISRPDDKSSEKKTRRYNIISEEAAKQSGRGIVPKISETVSFKKAVEQMKGADIAFMCYEAEDTDGGNDLKSFLQKSLTNETKSVAFFVGSEGGISEDEAEFARANGISCVSLGKRILRTETAPLCVLSCIMYETDNMK